MKKVCRNCRWWRYIVDQSSEKTLFGACHRSPPLGNSWPKVLADDFCGEFEFSDKANGEREITGVDNGK